MNLTSDKIRELKKSLNTRTPIFYCTELVDEIVCGTGIDIVLENKLSFFNKRIHKGFFIPLRLQIIIEGLFPDNTYS